MKNIYSIRLSKEYECYPLWIKEKEKDIYVNIDHRTLHELNSEDIYKLDLYQKMVSETYNASYPPDSGFKDVETQLEFEKLSEEICIRLKEIFTNTRKIYRENTFLGKFVES